MRHLTRGRPGHARGERARRGLSNRRSRDERPCGGAAGAALGDRRRRAMKRRGVVGVRHRRTAISGDSACWAASAAGERSSLFIIAARAVGGDWWYPASPVRALTDRRFAMALLDAIRAGPLRPAGPHVRLRGRPAAARPPTALWRGFAARRSRRAPGGGASRHRNSAPPRAGMPRRECRPRGRRRGEELRPDDRRLPAVAHSRTTSLLLRSSPTLCA